MKILAVETATEACSAALLVHGEVFERWELAPRAHTRLIMPMIDSLMAEAGLVPNQLDAVAFGCGPGSFTGVRIATAVAQGIALGADLPVLPVSTLAALAQDFYDRNAFSTLFTAMDARMDEIFWGVYQRGQQGMAELVGKESVIDVAHLPLPKIPGVGLGSGWLAHGQGLKQRLAGLVEGVVAENVWPKAAAVARLGGHLFKTSRAVSVEFAQPVYLRDKVAKTEEERGFLM